MIGTPSTSQMLLFRIRATATAALMGASLALLPLVAPPATPLGGLLATITLPV